MNYAVDKDAIIQVVTHGVGTPMTSYMSSATPLHVGDEPLYPVDVEKAKALMKEAGFENGFSTSLLVLAGNQDEIGIATALQQMWGAIGIKLELQQVDNATRTEQYRDGTFTMRLGAWTDDIADPNEITSYFAYSPTIDALHSGLEERGGRQALRGVAEGDGPGEAGGAIREDPGDLQRDRADRAALPDALSGRAPQEGEGLRADSARQQHLRGDLPGEVTTAAAAALQLCRAAFSQSDAEERPALCLARVLSSAGCCSSSRPSIFIFVVIFVIVRLLPGDPTSAILGDRATDADVERINRKSRPRQAHPGAVPGIRRAHAPRRSRLVDQPESAGAGPDPPAPAGDAALDRHGRRDRRGARRAACVRRRAPARSGWPTTSSAGPFRSGSRRRSSISGWCCSRSLPRGSAGFRSAAIGETFAEHLYHLFLPALTLALSLAAVLMRNLRGGNPRGHRSRVRRLRALQGPARRGSC